MYPTVRAVRGIITKSATGGVVNARVLGGINIAFPCVERLTSNTTHGCCIEPTSVPGNRYACVGYTAAVRKSRLLLQCV